MVIILCRFQSKLEEIYKNYALNMCIYVCIHTTPRHPQFSRKFEQSRIPGLPSIVKKDLEVHNIVLFIVNG